MKTILASFLTVALLASVGIAEAKVVQVKGYVKKSTGTYVAPSFKTSPNKSKLDNYSTKGNTNPYTGKKGTKNY